MTSEKHNDTVLLNECIHALSLGPEGEIWQTDWVLSRPSFIPDRVFFLEPDFVMNICRDLKMSEDVINAFGSSLDIFKGNLMLQRLAWHCHYTLFQTSENDFDTVKEWPILPKDISMFYAFIYLSGIPYIKKIHQTREIPESVTRDTLSDLELWIRDYRNRHGKWGLAQVGWLRHHFNGRLFKLGRLQFLLSDFCHDFHVFRNIRDKKIIVLAGQNMQFRKDGQFDGTNNIFDIENRWISEFLMDNDYIYGNPILVTGCAYPIKIKLKKSEWRQVLGYGDSVLDIHIPAAGSMEHVECGESFREAVTFFAKYFPDYKINSFTCTSWFLDHQFELYLPETSNIVRFLKEVYLIPVPAATDASTFYRIWGQKQIDDLDKLQQETSLQRAVIKHLKSGGYWHSGGCLLFPDDLNWGNQVYRKNEVTRSY